LEVVEVVLSWSLEVVEVVLSWSLEVVEVVLSWSLEVVEVVEVVVSSPWLTPHAETGSL
jgi:hypothetical protein